MGRSMQTNLIDYYPKVLKNLTEDTTGLTMTGFHAISRWYEDDRMVL